MKKHWIVFPPCFVILSYLVKKAYDFWCSEIQIEGKIGGKNMLDCNEYECFWLFNEAWFNDTEVKFLKVEGTLIFLNFNTQDELKGTDHPAV